MTAFEEWLTKTAAGLVPDPQHAPSCAALVGGECDCGIVLSSLEQRIAIGLVQARALECRSLAAQLQIRNLQNTPDGAYLFTKLWDRSHALEKLGLELCKQYPPDTPAAEIVEEKPGPRLVQ